MCYTIALFVEYNLIEQTLILITMFKRIVSVSTVLFLMGLTAGTATAANRQETGVADVNITQQNAACTGVVRDAAGEPIVGASVIVKGTSNGANTDLDGTFSLKNVKAGATLRVSYIGYKAVEVKWNGGPLDVVLEEDDTALGEVVVTALGIQRQEKALGYAMTELKGEELNANLINPVQALQGKVAGVEITASDGGMFGASKILIRGASTLNKNNQPIYVVDGIILDNGIVENDADWASGGQNYGNELKNLNPDDFETVSVLKGAAATALYGSRGLNGAVVITTKSGKGKKGLGINFSQTFGFDVVTSQPHFQNEYMDGCPSMYRSSDNIWDINDLNIYNENGIPSLYKLTELEENGLAFGPAFSNYEQLEWYDKSIIPSRAYKNNFKDAYDTGFNTNTNVAISGGNETTTFYTSLSYKYANGTLPNNDFQRFSILAKGTHKISRHVEFEAGITFVNSTPRNAQPNIGENFASGAWDRTYDSAYFRDKYKGDHGGLASTAYGDAYGRVPGIGTWWSIWENNSYQKETVVRPNLKLTAQLTPWLKWVTDGSYNYYYTRYESKQPGSGYANKGGYYQINQSQKEQINLNTNLVFDKSFGEDWNINGFLRYELFHNYQNYQSINTEGDFIIPNQYFINNGSKGYKATGYITGEKTVQSIAAQVAVGWRNQLFVDVTARNDWSSALVYADGHGTYSYFYPSINASWLISETFRDKLPEWVTFMKLRASLAQVGNDCSAYYINSAYSLNSYDNPDGSGKYYTLSLPSTTYSQNLKPERKTSWEIGIDWRFFQNRLGLDLTYYKENTKDQIMTVSLPGVSGYKNALINAGNIQNSGIELALNTTPIKTTDWQWDLNFTWTKNKSKIVELSDLVADYISLNGNPDYGNYRIGSVAKVGGTYGMLMSDSSAKLDYIYAEDGETVIGGTGEKMLVYSDASRYAYYQRSGKVEEVGNSVPDFLGSINTSLRWKNLMLSVSLDMRFGGKVASYNSHYGLAYGYTETSLFGRDENHGGITWTSGFDGKTYHDGVIPEGIVPAGTQITMPNGDAFVVEAQPNSTGTSYRQLYDMGVLEPLHHAQWTYPANSWSKFTLSDDWFTTLNYIALRDITLTYTLPQTWADKLRAKRLNVAFSGHNLGYLLNTMPNKENPEAIAGTTAAEFRIRQYAGVTSSFNFTISASF